MIVKCINEGDAKGCNTLTLNKVYQVLDHSATGWQIENDLGDSIWVGLSNFRLV